MVAGSKGCGRSKVKKTCAFELDCTASVPALKQVNAKAMEVASLFTRSFGRFARYFRLDVAVTAAAEWVTRMCISTGRAASTARPDRQTRPNAE